MKKLIFLFFSLLASTFVFQACNDSKTYAEMLEDEKKAINRFISENNITVISVDDFEKDTITKCPPYGNEYVRFSNGVYMQIVKRGEGDTIRDRSIVSVRFMEYDILEGDTTGASNYYMPEVLDVFDYTEYGTTMYGQFRDESYSMLAYFYNTTQVPTGWLVPLRYIKNDAHVKVIVPSKVGHTHAMNYVYPYYYDLRHILIHQ